MSAETRFRTDINGLRAVAVLAVMLYHFGVPSLQGGYVGVDVFFVISGFLMTQIVLTRLTEGRFSFAQFYAARLRRIVPALAIVCLLLLAGGFVWLVSIDYDRLARDAVASLFFKSNIVYARKAGYFDIVSRERWLLHTWSLSVEAQFYLVYPFILAALYRIRRVKEGVIALFAASLLLAGLYTHHDPAKAFYLLPTRMWEFLAGGLVFLLPVSIAHLEKAGLALIAAAVFIYPDTLEYPGFYALLPVLGAAFVLKARSEGALLSNRTAQFFGDISYSLYLWHWPVVLAVKYFDVALTPVVGILMTVGTVALSWASYRWIETPFRHMRLPDVKSLAVCAAVVLVVALPAQAVSRMDGVPARLAETVQMAEAATKDSNPRQSECLSDGKAGVTACLLGAPVAPSVALWGDSHADAVFVAVDVALGRTGRGGVFYGLSSCPPVVKMEKKKAACASFTQEAFGKIVADPKLRDVLIVAHWTYYPLQPAALADTVCALRDKGKTVHILATTPEMDRPAPVVLAKSRLLYGRDVDIVVTRADYAARNAETLKALELARTQCGARILDPWPRLCGKGDCHVVRDGRSLYRDEQHLDRFGAGFLEPLFRRALGGK